MVGEIRKFFRGRTVMFTPQATLSYVQMYSSLNENLKKKLTPFKYPLPPSPQNEKSGSNSEMFKGNKIFTCTIMRG